MSICLRYVVDGKTSETFVGFCETDSVTGEALFQVITTKIQQLGLEIKSIVGQCYDGAAIMSGYKKGVASRIQEVAAFAIYVHCYAHLLNLALQDTLEHNRVLKNSLGMLQSLYNFFNSPKREGVL